MVRVNRHSLKSKDLESLFYQFDIFLNALDKSATGTFLNELLGREERLTYAKRLAAIILLSEGASDYKTAQVLKLSPTTTGKISNKMRTGGYDDILFLLKKNKKNYTNILKIIDQVLHLNDILPHYNGLDRYRNI